jgi:poly-gamma-glutamate synthesis protein (capsule biosynthesis protein)
MRYLPTILISSALALTIVSLGVIPHFLKADTDSSVASTATFVVPVKKQNTIEILFLGDLMLDRHVALKMDSNGVEYPFLLIKDFLKSADFVVANAEGVFSDNTSITKGVANAPLRFTFATSTLPMLKALGFTAFSQANNHNADFGAGASASSHEAIGKTGILPFGDYWNETVGPVYMEKNGQKIALVGFNEFSYRNIEHVDEAIKVAKANGAYTIVFPHWGIEYSQGVSAKQREWAHRFVDDGADVVIGAHPHVVEPIELYNGSPIFYSLGNFIFDQYQPHTREALAVTISLKNQMQTFTLNPLVLTVGQTSLASEGERGAMLDFLSTAPETSDTLRSSIEVGAFSLNRRN